MDQALVALISIATAVIIALIGVVYRSLSLGLEKKVDKELYIKTIGSIESAVQGINGTATTLKQVVENVSDIHKTFLTVKEHEYKCTLHAMEIENKVLKQRAKRQTDEV